MEAVERMAEWAAGAPRPQLAVATAGGNAAPAPRVKREKTEAEIIAQNNAALRQLRSMMGNVRGGLGV